jgi:cyanophycinase
MVRTRPRSAAGRLLVIGGAESHNEDDETILERFVELAGGARARLVVIATASSQPERLEAEYVAVFQRLGAGDVRPLRLNCREQANSGTATDLLERATGVFFTGGDQLRIASIVGGTRADSVLHARLTGEDGLVLAGTSAGAAMMSSTMILGGQDAAVSTSSVRLGPGLEFLPGVLIDMHFAERGRLNRLLSAIALYPHELGLGIDENTAILVEDGRFEVIGTGSVTVIDAGPAALIQVEGSGPIALSDVRLHVLPSGYAFELTERRPLEPARQS